MQSDLSPISSTTCFLNSKPFTTYYLLQISRSRWTMDNTFLILLTAWVMLENGRSSGLGESLLKKILSHVNHRLTWTVDTVYSLALKLKCRQLWKNLQSQLTGQVTHWRKSLIVGQQFLGFTWHVTVYWMTANCLLSKKREKYERPNIKGIIWLVIKA